MVELESLRGLDRDQIVDLLLDQQEQSITFSLPKETSLFNSDRSAIAAEYLQLAFVGQRLADVSLEFDYDVLLPHENGNFCFEIKANDIEALAEALLDISYGFVNDHEDDIYFPELVSEFEGNIEMKNYRVACPEFIEFYEEYSEPQEEV